MSFITFSNADSLYEFPTETPSSAQPVASSNADSLYEFPTETPTSAQPIPPSQPIEIPSTLTLVHNNKYILFETTKKAEFLEWHTKTIWYYKQEQRPSKQVTRIAWGHRKQSKIWDQLCEVADKKDGTPKILCRRCDKILQHPAGKGKSSTNSSRTGTSHLKNHLQSDHCMQASRRANLRPITWARHDTESRAVPSHVLLQFLPVALTSNRFGPFEKALHAP
jgi:hypothetical protein